MLGVSLCRSTSGIFKILGYYLRAPNFCLEFEDKMVRDSRGMDRAFFKSLDSEAEGKIFDLFGPRLHNLVLK